LETSFIQTAEDYKAQLEIKQITDQLSNDL
jgi:hypothetical protein